MHKQLVISGTPKPRGGARKGSGRRKGAVKTQTIRVSEAVVEQCKALDAAYRASLSTETEAVLISLGNKSVVVEATAEEWAIADRLVDEWSQQLSRLSEKQQKSFVAMLCRKVFR